MIFTSSELNVFVWHRAYAHTPWLMRIASQCVVYIMKLNFSGLHITFCWSSMRTLCWMAMICWVCISFRHMSCPELYAHTHICFLSVFGIETHTPVEWAWSVGCVYPSDTWHLQKVCECTLTDLCINAVGLYWRIMIWLGLCIRQTHDLNSFFD